MNEVIKAINYELGTYTPTPRASNPPPILRTWEKIGAEAADVVYGV